MEQIFRKLEDENVCSYDDLMDAAANYSYNYSFLDQSMQGDAKRLEGFLFPDTYEFYQGMQASSAINKFLETSTTASRPKCSKRRMSAACLCRRSSRSRP